MPSWAWILIVIAVVLLVSRGVSYRRRS